MKCLQMDFFRRRRASLSRSSSRESLVHCDSDHEEHLDAGESLDQLLTTTSQFVGIGGNPFSESDETASCCKETHKTADLSILEDCSLSTEKLGLQKDVAKTLERTAATRDFGCAAIADDSEDDVAVEMLHDCKSLVTEEGVSMVAEKNSLHSTSCCLVPLDRNEIQTDGSSMNFSQGFSVKGFDESPCANKNVLRAEVARLEAQNAASTAAIDKAHRQVEEQEAFALKLQRRLQDSDKRLRESNEQRNQLHSEVCLLREKVQIAEQDLKDKQTQIQDLKCEIDKRNDQLKEKSREIELQKHKMLSGEEKLSALKEECLRLQTDLKTELVKQESVLAQEKQQTQWLDTLRRENSQLQEQMRLLSAENLDAHKKHEDWELLRASLMKTVEELRVENASLSRRIARQSKRMKELEINSIAGAPAKADSNSEEHYQASLHHVPHLKHSDPLPSGPKEGTHATPSMATSTSSCHSQTEENKWQHHDQHETHLILNTAHPRHHKPSPLTWDMPEAVPFQSSTHIMMNAPYARKHSIQDVQRLTSRLERDLLQLSMQRNKLESEYVKMPAHTGRTMAAQMRKKEIERQMDGIAEEMSRIRYKLKYITGGV